MIQFAFQNTLQDFLRLGRFLTWGLVALGVGIAAFIWARFQPGAGPETYGQVSQVIVLRVLALSSAIFTVQVISAEVEQKTIVYWLTRRLSRTQVLVSRTLASVVAVIATTSAAWFVAGLAVLGPRAFQTGAFWWDFVLIVVGAFAYGTFFVFLSLLLNKAMIFCLLFAFGWETFIPNMPGDLTYMSIYPYLRALSKHPAPAPQEDAGLTEVLSGGLSSISVAPHVAWMVLLGIIVFFAGLSIYWFNHFEYSPREDSE